MWQSIQDTIQQYTIFYGSYFSKQWNDLGPTGYGILLIGIGFFGWLLMKSGMKRPGG